MKKYLVQVTLGDMFEDVSVEAESWEGAVAAAKTKMAGTVFGRSRWTNYVV